MRIIEFTGLLVLIYFEHFEFISLSINVLFLLLRRVIKGKDKGVKS